MRSMLTPVVALLSIAVAAMPARAQIPWNNDLQAAHAQAKQEGKRLLLHFYTDNCVFCERLEAGAFQSPVLAAAINKNFVPVKIHAAMNPNIAKTFRVTRFPTDVIVTTDGTVLAHGVSPQDPNKFAGLLAQHAPSPTPQTALAQTQTPPSAPVASLPQPTSEKRSELAPTPTVSTMAVSSPMANPYAQSTVAAEQDPQSPSEQGFSLPTNLGGTSANVAAYRSRNNPPLDTAATVPSGDSPSGDYRPIPVTSGPAMEKDDVEIAPELEADLMPRTAPTASDESADNDKFATKTPSHSGTPPVALQGFCPVSLKEQWEWIAGDPNFGTIHLGQLYLFADETSLAKFRDNPESYTPVMNGNDVVLFFEEHRVVEGRRDWGLVDPEFNRIFLFATEETMQHFFEHHEDYVRSAITVTRQAAAEANRKHR